jgi:predicted negative regulator of RcsB-dependent stress response
VILLALALQAAAVDTAACAKQAQSDPVAGERAAERWALAGGAHAAQQCRGIALAAQSRYPEAASAFEAAARAAEQAKDTAAAGYWAQAGNAWLAGQQPAKARTALDAALAAGTLGGLERGEAQLDRARALVAANDLKAARVDLDAATANAPDDPLAWLLSATLARRTNDPARAKADIAQALRLAPDDASVQLEAGNIAALAGDEAQAKAAWTEAARIAPTAPAGQSAAKALAQFTALPARN